MRAADYTPDRDSAAWGRARVSTFPLRGLQRPALGTREDRWRGQVCLARLIRRATDGLQRAIPNVGRVAHPTFRTFNDDLCTRSTIGSSRSVSFNSRKTSSKAVTIALTTSGSKTRPCNSRRIGTRTSDMERPPERFERPFCPTLGYPARGPASGHRRSEIQACRAMPSQA
jgi:hypothetical protein